MIRQEGSLKNPGDGETKEDKLNFNNNSPKKRFLSLIFLEYGLWSEVLIPHVNKFFWGKKDRQTDRHTIITTYWLY